ncbi:MAG TPA: FlgD immunoglobulin-like domain containing protein [Steroidobacteraceae bacterium]|nr:FlgD immunoglobulin-like domain containing protein [Candidatus Acidoferrales bacterium]HUN24776.1 FlgD immunoglobulin-like domain containing protein [Steroidobacteraceae bacterium]
MSRARVVVAGAAWFAAFSAVAGTASFTLPEAATTSAAVFDGGGRLVRTLWSGEKHLVGSVTVTWDGRDDNGARVAPGSKYSARLLVSNVRYIWEGVIANTSAEMSGPHVYRALGPINDMAIDARGDAFYVVGYDEQQNAIHRFNTSDPQRPTSLAHDDYRRVFRFAATDGTLAYFANVGLAAPKGSPMRDPSTFVIALRVNDGAEFSFTHGRSVTSGLHWGNRWDSVIDLDDDDLDSGGVFRSAPSGLAVQRRGRDLFVAHALRNEIRVLDKRTGELLGRIAAERPTSLGVASDDTLWALCRTGGRAALVHFHARGEQWVTDARVTAGLDDPVALGVSPVDGTVVVADAGSEQLRAFSALGRPVWIFGREGGYRSGGPEVTEDKLSLSAGPTYVAFQSDGSFWVGDPGDARDLHFSAERKYLDQIMYMPVSYHAAVDPANPRRVFDRFLEFSVDYSRALGKSWRLVRNWAAGLPEYYFWYLDGLRTVVTLRNGRTYGVLGREGGKIADVLELSSSGLRPTGTHLEVGEQLYPDGSIRSFVQRGRTFEVYVRRLAGFDGSANPRWEAPAPLAGVAYVLPADPYYHDVPLVGGVNEARFPQTSSGVVVFFNPGASNGFHLGGVRAGEQRWLWRASPTRKWSVNRAGEIVSPDGSFDIDRGVQYPGNTVVTAGRQIIYGYHGEGWNGGEADQWMHFLDDGQFIGQFGEPVYASRNRVSAAPGEAGNAFSPQLVRVDGQYYLWHNDESVHGGVHRWHLEGVDGIRVLEHRIDP